MPVDPTTVTLPAELIPGDGRFGSGPSKVRPEAARALAEVGRQWLGTSHRQRGVRRSSAASAPGCASSSPSPTATRCCSATGEHRVLGCGRVRSRRPPRRAPRVRRVLVEVRGGHRARRRSSTTRWCFGREPGTHPELVADATVDTYAYPHNETSTGVMTDVRRPGDDGLVLVDATSGAGGLPRRADPLRRVLLRAAEVLRRRRRTLDRALFPRGHRAHRTSRRERAVGPAVAQPADRARELAPRPDLQHARARRRCSCSRTACAGCSIRAGSSSPSAAAIGPPSSSTAGRRQARSPSRSWPSRRSAAT